MNSKDTKYAFVMIDYQNNNDLMTLKDEIDDDDYYKPMEEKYKFQIHVTLAACLDNDIDKEEVKEYLMPLKSYPIMIKDISLFENDDYDVVKCNVYGQNLNKTNKEILKNFKSHSEYKEYHPHVTLGYVKKGLGKKYTKKLSRTIILKPKCFDISYYKGDKEKNYTFNI